MLYWLSQRIIYISSSPPALYTRSLHDALPIYQPPHLLVDLLRAEHEQVRAGRLLAVGDAQDDTVIGRHHLAVQPVALLDRSEEHTSELQSRGHLVCRLLLEKKKKLITNRR